MHYFNFHDHTKVIFFFGVFFFQRRVLRVLWWDRVLFLYFWYIFPLGWSENAGPCFPTLVCFGMCHMTFAAVSIRRILLPGNVSWQRTRLYFNCTGITETVRQRRWLWTTRAHGEIWYKCWNCEPSLPVEKHFPAVLNERRIKSFTWQTHAWGPCLSGEITQPRV